MLNISNGPGTEPARENKHNIEMPDADKANRQIIGDKAKAYEQGAMEERQENRSRTIDKVAQRIRLNRTID